jgi:hypothetical protein
MIGSLILKKSWFKPWKTMGHSLFYICWLPLRWLQFGQVAYGVASMDIRLWIF